MRALHPDLIQLDRIRADTHGLATLGDRFPLDHPVPTCGAWVLADLIRHLYEVQHFWCHIIGGRPIGPDDYERPRRLPDHQLAEALRSVDDELLGLLAAADPTEQAWSWSEEQTVGFTMRRQTHEALVHHIDGCLACGVRLPTTPPLLAADGVDEMLTVMLAVDPATEGMQRADEVIELVTSDTGDRWRLAFCTMAGVEDADAPTATPGLVAESDRAPTATVEGPALAMDLWLWGRDHGPAMVVDGDPDVPRRLQALIAGRNG